MGIHRRPLTRREALVKGTTAAATAGIGATMGLGPTGPATAAPAGDKRLRDAVREELAAAIKEGFPGLTIAALAGGRTYVAGAGHVAGAGSPAPDGETIFQLGSVTKTFTATALALDAELGRLRLTDPANKHLPSRLALPSAGNQVITLTQLSNHTSGLPRLPVGIDQDPAFDPRDPYAKFTLDKLAASLTKTTLATPPGTKSEYSNLGVGMLGHALTVRSGRSYANLIRPITSTLGMRDTGRTLSPSQLRRKAAGHDAEGKSTVDWHVASLEGAITLYGTGNDLLRYLRAQLAGAPGPLGRAIKRTHQPTHKESPRLSLGLGWHLTPLKSQTGSHRMIWHNGGTGGFRSFIAFVPDSHTAVAVLTNSSRDSEALGARLLSKLGSFNPVEFSPLDHANCSAG